MEAEREEGAHPELTGIVAELAGILAGKEIDLSEEGRAGSLAMKASGGGEVPEAGEPRSPDETRERLLETLRSRNRAPATVDETQGRWVETRTNCVETREKEDETQTRWDETQEKGDETQKRPDEHLKRGGQRLKQLP